jgi:diguanylate cyclase (GGDEF)-like protein
LDAQHRVSLVTAGGYNLAITVMAVALTIASALAGIYYLTLHHDATITALRAERDAEQLVQQLSSYRRVLETLSASDEVARLVATQTGGAPYPLTELLSKYLPQSPDLAFISRDYRASGQADSNKLPPGCKIDEKSDRLLTDRNAAHWRSGQSGYVALMVLVRERVTKKPIGFLCADFLIDTLQSGLAELVQPGQQLLLRDSSGQVMAASGEAVHSNSPLTATAAIADSDWRLQLSETAARHDQEYLVIGGLVSLFAFVPLLIGMSGMRLLRTAATELKAIGDFLRQVGGTGFQVDPPSCKIEETATLIPVLQHVVDNVQKNQEAISELSFTDGLTKLPNRHYFLKMLNHAFELARRGTDICLLLLEVSDFKKANDMLGSEAADEILRMVAETLRAQTRKSDVAGRLGVFGFGAILYRTKGHLIRNRLAQLQQDFVKRQKNSQATAGTIYCRLTCGLTYIDREKDARPEDTLLRADSALRAARNVGGNQIEMILSPQADERRDNADAAASASPADRQTPA